MPASDARVFISYSRKDGKPFADALRDRLIAEGLSVWQDLIALAGQQYFWSQIEGVLRSPELEHFVLVVTPQALQGRWVRDEIRLARQEGKTVSPVKGTGLEGLAALPRWLGNVYDLDLPERWTKLLHVLRGPSTQARVARMAPEPPADFVARPVEFDALKRRLIDAKGDSVAITAALRGAGGYGKTMLAKALAHDPEIADPYFDGTLWAVLGEKADNLLATVSDLITRLTGTPPQLETLNAAASALGDALGKRRILLVVDDVWREQDLRPFLEGGPNTTRLITTRDDRVLPGKAITQPVDEMRKDEALLLLTIELPAEQVIGLHDEFIALAARLGEWPQLLGIINGFLRRAVKNRQPLAQAVAGVNQRLTDKGLRAFDAAKKPIAPGRSRTRSESASIRWTRKVRRASASLASS